MKNRFLVWEKFWLNRILIHGKLHSQYRSELWTEQLYLTLNLRREYFENSINEAKNIDLRSFFEVIAPSGRYVTFFEEDIYPRTSRSNCEDAILPQRDLSIEKKVVRENRRRFLHSGRHFWNITLERYEERKREKICVRLRTSLDVENHLWRFPILLSSIICQSQTPTS